MISDRRAATLIGVLYIIGTVSGLTAALIMPSFAPDADLLGRIGANRAATIVGALCILTMGFSLSALSALFFPIGRRYSEVLAGGYLLFRGAIEGVVTLLMTLIALTLVALASDTSGAPQTAVLLATAHRVLGEQLGPLPFVVGALFFYWLLFRHRLVPRWITIWGLAAAPLYAGAGFARMAGLDLDLLMIPLALQEMVLAIWLIARGFDAEALLRGTARVAPPPG